jgi:hypothetical protein
MRRDSTAPGPVMGDEVRELMLERPLDFLLTELPD